MSSPNHPTYNIEDVFSLNFPDYLSASPNYVPASLGETYSSSSNSFGLVPIASPTLSLFHDDSYMKEFSSGHDQSSSSTSTLPQAFEIGESSHKTSLKRHEEQIKGILNHLDELSLDRIEHIEKNRRMPPKRNSASVASPSEAPAVTQAAIRQLVVDSVATALETQTATRANANNANRNPEPREAPVARKQLVVDSVATALETQTTTRANANNANRNPEPREAPVARKCSYKEFMSCQPLNFKGSEGAIGLIYWFECTESVFSYSICTEDCKVKFATRTLTKEALSWWNSFAQPIGIE
nr:reverse transcriptase domain-containing protein [Tanacetum cinerariifolium]